MFTIAYHYASNNFSRFYNMTFTIYDTNSGLLYTRKPDGTLTSKPTPDPCWSSHLVSIPEFFKAPYRGAFSTLEEATFAKAFLIEELRSDAKAYADSITAKANKLPSNSSIITNFQSLHPEHFL